MSSVKYIYIDIIIINVTFTWGFSTELYLEVGMYSNTRAEV